MRRSFLLILLASLLLTVPGTQANAAQSNASADAFSSEVASSWFELLYDVVKAERTAPPPAARIYGISSVALYESIVSGAEANRSLVGQLKPRIFDSFHEAAAEAAISRLYGGIHYRFDNNNGLICGQCIGQKIQERVSFSTN